MAGFRVPITQQDAQGNYKGDDSVILPRVKRRGDGFTVLYRGVGGGTGLYDEQADIPFGVYDFYDNDNILLNVFGSRGRPLGHPVDEFLPLSGNREFYNADGKRITSPGLPVSGADVGDRNFNDGRYASVASFSNLATLITALDAAIQALDNSVLHTVGNLTETATGLKSFASHPKRLKQEFNSELLSEDVETFVTLFQLRKELAAITLPPFPLPPRSVLVWGGAGTVTGKIYNEIKLAADYLGALQPSAAKRAKILIESMGHAYSMVAKPGALQDYIDIVGKFAGIITEKAAPNWKNNGTNIVVCSANSSKYMTFSNSVLFFGAGGELSNETGDRIYSNPTYENCVIYSYNNLDLIDCNLKGTLIINAPGKKTTLKGGTFSFNSSFNNVELDDSLVTPPIGGSTAKFDFPNMPDDPTMTPNET